MSRIFARLLVRSMALPVSLAQAAPAPPIGLWKTNDDESGAAEPLMRITQTDGVVSAE